MQFRNLITHIIMQFLSLITHNIMQFLNLNTHNIMQFLNLITHDIMHKMLNGSLRQPFIMSADNLQPDADGVDTIVRHSHDTTEPVIQAAEIGKNATEVDDVASIVVPCHSQLSGKHQRRC